MVYSKVSKRNPYNRIWTDRPYLHHVDWLSESGREVE